MQALPPIPGEWPPGEVMVRIPVAIAPAIGSESGAIAPTRAAARSQPTAAADDPEGRADRRAPHDFSGDSPSPQALPPPPMPIWLLTGGQIRLAAKRGPQGPDVKVASRGLCNYVSCSFVIQSVPAGIPTKSSGARSPPRFVKGARRLVPPYNIDLGRLRSQRAASLTVASTLACGFYPRPTRLYH